MQNDLLIKLQNLYKSSLNQEYGFYVFCDLFARIIVDDASFDSKVYQIIQDHYQHFIHPSCNDRLFLLETPPRTGKSLLTTVLGSVYIALCNPKQRGVIITSNETTRKTSFHLKIKQLVTSDLFLAITELQKKDFQINEKMIIFPNRFILQSQTTHASNPIGTGYHWIILDDFMQHAEINSPTKLQTAHNILTNLLTRKEFNRRTNKLSTKIIVANQRLGFNDVSTRFRESFEADNVPFIQLTMPYHFRVHGDTEYKLFNGKTIKFERNEYLAPLFNPTNEQEEMALLGRATFYTQYLQIATQDELSVFDVRHLQYYEKLEDIENVTSVFITVDFAFKTKSHNDYTACIFWGADLRDIQKPKLYVLDIIHHKKLIADTIPIIVSYYYKWHNFTGSNKWHSSFQGIFIEDVSSNEAVFPLLQQNAPEIMITKIQRSSNDKLARANDILPTFRKDVVYLPKNHDLTEAFVNETRAFTRNNTHKHDDLVDCLIDGIKHGVMENMTSMATNVNRLAERVGNINIMQAW